MNLYSDCTEEFKGIFHMMAKIEECISPADASSKEKLRSIQTSLLQLQQDIALEWQNQREKEEAERKAEEERIARERKRYEENIKAHAARSSTGKTVVDWMNATRDDHRALNQILQEVQSLRERVRALHGTPEYEEALAELHRTVNRRCFEKDLPPYIMEQGEYPGYGK